MYTGSERNLVASINTTDSMTMSFPNPPMGDVQSWADLAARRGDLDTVPSRPSSRQSVVSNLSDLTMASELLHSEVASDAHTHASIGARRGSIATARAEKVPSSAKTRAVQAMDNIVQFFWGLFKAAFLLVANALFPIVSRARQVPVGATISQVGATLVEGASAAILATHKWIRSKLGWGFILAYVAPFILLALQSNANTDLVKGEQSFVCKFAPILVGCTKSTASLSQPDASTDPQTIVFQQSAELQTIFKTSISNVEMGQTLLASSDAFGTLAGRVQDADLEFSSVLVNSLLEFSGLATRSRFRLGDFQRSINDGTSSLTALVKTLSQQLEGEGKRASATNVFGVSLGRDDNARIQAAATRSYQQLCEGFNRQGTQILAEAYKTRDELVGLRSKLKEIAELIWLHKGVLDEKVAKLLSEVWTKLGFNGKRVKHFDGLHELLRVTEDMQIAALAYVNMMIESLEGGYLRLDNAKHSCRAPKLSGNSFISLETHLGNLRSVVEPFQDRTPVPWMESAKKFIARQPRMYPTKGIEA